MTDYNATYWGRVVNAISQLGNALCGGNPDVAISARIGYMAKSNFFWVVCESIVDFTFYPIDGKGHCHYAYLSDRLEDHNIGKGWLPGLIIMSILMVVVCVIIAPITYLCLGISKIVKNG